MILIYGTPKSLRSIIYLEKPMSLILFQQEGPIGRLHLNNPANLNAMTPEMGDAIQQAVASLQKIPELRVVLISGEGRAFSAGGDLNFILEHSKNTYEDNQKEMVEFYAKFLALRDIPVPTIAVLNGPAVGAGLLIALACDLRYASSQAKLAANFAKLGISSGMGGLYWLTKLTGPAVAAELLFTGRSLSAEEARTLGLVNEVFPPEELEARVLEIAKQIAANAPEALKILKKGVQLAVTANLEEIITYESHGQAKTFATQDLIEGVEAIKTKRAPHFRGK
jgi:enoyl-CoA hydratase/carnithine racemase